MNNDLSKSILFSNAFSSRTKLTIILADDCNAKCPFCVAKNNEKYIEEPLNALIQKLDLSIKKYNVQNINITGGEPTISKKIIPILNEIKKYQGRLNDIVLKTNGYMLRNKFFLNQLLDSCLTIISISYHHFDKKRNDEFMNIDTLNRDEIKAIYESAKLKGKKLRINLTINKKEICNSENINRFVQYFNKCTDVIRIAPMVKVEQHKSNIEIAKYTNECAYSIDEYIAIVNEFSNMCDTKTEKESTSEFDNFRQIVYKDGQKVELRLRLPMEKSKKNNRVIEMQLHPDGVLCVDWDRKYILN